MVISTSDLNNLTDSKELSRYLLDKREDLAAQVDNLSGIEMMRAYSDLTDALISRIFDIAIDGIGADSTSMRRKALRSIAIAAVGGYGRMEMSPFSDVDVTFLVGNEEDEDIEPVIKRAFRILMDTLDTAGLKVGYSYRQVDEVENLPLETLTALLDARCIAGSAYLFSRFESALKKAIVPAAFVTDHIRTRNNPGGLQDTPFVVEPDIKEGRGGLRDLHAARWIAKVAFDFTGECIWEDLRSRGIVSDTEINEIKSATEFISQTRNILHLISGRGQNVLSAEKHIKVSERMGFADVDDFISQYYAHSQQLWLIYKKVAEAGLEQSLEIEPGIIARAGLLRIADKGILTRDPSSVIRIFQHAHSYHLEISREARDLIVFTAGDYKLTSDASRTFLDMLSGPGVSPALRLMADLGILQAIIPQFDEMMYLVPGDAAHQFTVGEHSLRTVEKLDALFSEYNELFADVFSRIQLFEVLYFAALLHDIGKLDSKRDHAKTGALCASKLASDLGMPEDLYTKVEFLVRNHLVMSETARLRDLNQKKTIKNFITIVNDQQLLDMLLLLTVADYRAVGTTNWSQVQTRFLLELHERVMSTLRSPSSASADIERHRTRVKRELCLANLPPDEVDEHCASLPASYLLNAPPDELAIHIGHVRTVRNGTPAIDIKDDRGGEFTELLVVATDKTGLLSKIAGVLYAMNIDVHAAQIFTRNSADQIAIDTWYIDYEGRQLAETKKWQLEGELLSVLTDSISVNDLLKRWGKKEYRKPNDATLKASDNLSDHETVLEVRAEDSPGILYCLTRKISEMGWNIHSARVATWGHEARDVFYVTNSNGNKLNSQEIMHFNSDLTE